MKKTLSVIVAALALTTGAFSQQTITVSGEVKKPLKLTLKDLEKYPVTEVKAKDKAGIEHSFRGTLLSVVLDSAGVTLGGDLRGENLTKYVLITAADNYKVIYSLAEIDSEFTSNAVLLATHVDGKPLSKGEGPFRLVNPGDKRPTRWVREISSIKVLFSKE